MPEVAPVPLLTNPIPKYPRLLLDAGLGDTVIVQFRVSRDGSVDQSSYCVERPPAYPSLDPSEVRQWRFSPAQHDGVVVAAKYRLTVIFAPRDTVRGPITGARILGEVRQPLLRNDHPRLVIGPMRLTFGVSRTGAVGVLDRSLQDSLIHQVLVLGDLNGGRLVCLRLADRSYLQWDGASRATKGEVMTRCGAGASVPRVEISLGGDESRGGRYEGGLIRVPVTLRTYDFSRCPPGAFLCGGGLSLEFDCEVRITNEGERADCVGARRGHWIS